MDDNKQLAKEYALERIKLENTISREALAMLIKLRHESRMANEKEAFDEARRFVSALEQGVYPGELEKRQALEAALQGIIHAADEMYAIMRLFEVDAPAVMHNYEYRKEAARMVLENLEKQTTRNVVVFLSEGDQEVHSYKIKAWSTGTD